MRPCTSVDHHEAVIWNATASTGNFRREDLPELDQSQSVLKRTSGGMKVVEVRHRHTIVPEDRFKMEPGFRNFQAVRRGNVWPEIVRAKSKPPRRADSYASVSGIR